MVSCSISDALPKLRGKGSLRWMCVGLRGGIESVKKKLMTLGGETYHCLDLGSVSALFFGYLSGEKKPASDSVVFEL